MKSEFSQLSADERGYRLFYLTTADRYKDFEQLSLQYKWHSSKLFVPPAQGFQTSPSPNNYVPRYDRPVLPTASTPVYASPYAPGMLAAPFTPYQQPYAQQPYAQQPYAQQPYAQQPYGNHPHGQQQIPALQFTQPQFVAPPPVSPSPPANVPRVENTEVRFLISGTPDQGPTTTNVAPALMAKLHAQIATWETKSKTPGVWKHRGPKSAERCADARAGKHGLVAHPPSTDPNVACAKCIRGGMLCVMNGPGWGPVVVPLPLHERAPNVTPTDVGYYIKGR